MEGLQNTIMRNRMTFCKRRVCRASAKDELQTIGRPPGQLGGAGRSADCSQLYALQFYTARCKHSALRAPCSQRFTPESGALRPTLMPEASFILSAAVLPPPLFTHIHPKKGRGGDVPRVRDGVPLRPRGRGGPVGQPDGEPWGLREGRLRVDRRGTPLGCRAPCCRRLDVRARENARPETRERAPGLECVQLPLRRTGGIRPSAPASAPGTAPGT